MDTEEYLEQQKRLKELQEFGELEGTEFGEAVQYVLALYDRRDYLSTNLAFLIEEEVDRMWDIYQKDYEIVEEETSWKQKTLKKVKT